MDFEIFGRSIDLFYLFSQLFALGATIFSLIAFQKRKKIQILNYTVIATVCSIFHYLFLGAWSGVASKSVGTVRNVLAAYETKKRKTSKIAPFIFIAFYVITGIITFESPASILPILAPSIFTLGIYFGNAARVRSTAVVASALWLIYNICVFSIVGIVAESVFIINDLIAIYRYRQRRDQRKPHPKSKRKTPRRPKK